MECEICGKRKAKYIIKIEGAQLNACEVCARGAKIISEIKQPVPVKHKIDKETTKVTVEEEVVTDYAERIRKAIKDLTLNVAVLAEKLNIKYSVMNNIAHGKVMPDIKLAKKLEKELNIKLIEEVVVETGSGKNKNNDELTLGDIVEVD